MAPFTLTTREQLVSVLEYVFDGTFRKKKFKLINLKKTYLNTEHETWFAFVKLETKQGVPQIVIVVDKPENPEPNNDNTKPPP